MPKIPPQDTHETRKPHFPQLETKTPLEIRYECGRVPFDQMKVSEKTQSQKSFNKSTVKTNEKGHLGLSSINSNFSLVEHDCRDNTQQQMLDDLAAEEDRKQQQQTIHAAMLLSQQQQQPRQPSCYQHVEKALADSTLDNQLVIDCPPSV